MPSSSAPAPPAPGPALTVPARPSLPFVLLEGENGAVLYSRPREVLRCDTPGEAEATLEALARAVAGGAHAAGFLAYELGYALEPRLGGAMPAERPAPLIWMGLFDAPRAIPDVGAALARWSRGEFGISHFAPAIDRPAYEAKLARIKELIAAGEVYQVNYTFPCRFRAVGDLFALYAALRRAQPARHAALIMRADGAILSLSPELFLDVAGGRVTTRPMKGTAARGADDTAARNFLANDTKNKAENLMIVDLMRNDLSRVAAPGSVGVPALFQVETLPTLHQMTSTVTARLTPGAGIPEIVKAVFPCGSITGAPKIRAMEIIRALEAAPRGVYCGAIGHFAPARGPGDAPNIRLSVAIRTLAIDSQGRGMLGIGGGIVHDSDARAEWREALLKSAFVARAEAGFQLIETMRWDAGGGIARRALHVARLTRSAAFFGFPDDEPAIHAALDAHLAGLPGSGERCGGYRIRLLLDDRGRVEITSAPAAARARVVRFVIAGTRVFSGDPFRRHKTTRRAALDTEYARAKARGADEALFLNEAGALTEGSRTTLFARIDGGWRTPPLAAGALDGTLRRSLLEGGAMGLVEARITPGDLARATEIRLGNAVIGLVPAEPLAREGLRGGERR